MKSSIMLAVFFCVFALMFLEAYTAAVMSEDEAEVESPLVRSKRAGCCGGEIGCAAYCLARGYHRGGCCGQQYTNCHNTCYCNGSGLEYRCYSCDL